LLASEEFDNHTSNLAFGVGKDIGGKTIITDIAKMPHLLIAGATGSGKSVCINTLIMSLLYKASPEDVKLIMVDPKVVELSTYNGIPHLLIPVVTDPKKAAGALNWAVAEMTRRYQLFADYQVRNLQGYNEKVKSIEMLEDDDKPQKLPQIVIIVDELADLMMVAPGDVEDAICRLAQLARAAGIHLIIATQRPSVNVITGLIKANIPGRIAFAVNNNMDSRVMLDMGGAEKLLGMGDMLYLTTEMMGKPKRVQGAYVSDDEIENLTNYLREQAPPSYNEEVISQDVAVKGMPGMAGAGGGDMGGGNGDIERQAAEIAIRARKLSTSLLQRQLRIGYGRAAAIIDHLEEIGVVGPAPGGSKPREVLISSMDEYPE
jgi:S-DNA-T family DNA segregation ATPase FtsK/SpoIIIE